MKSDVMRQDERRKAASLNRQTNFIAKDGFEAPPKPTFETGTVPSKGQADLSQVSNMIDNLRKEHFALGCQNPMFAKSSTIVGGGASKSALPTKAPWAHLRTNYALGIDKDAKQTDYQSRFQNSNSFTERGQSSPAQDAVKNKFKNSYATVKLEGSTRGFDPTTSMKT